MRRTPAQVGRIHELKIWPVWFRRVAAGEKKAELRRDDRDFQVGDLLRLREYVPEQPGPGRDGIAHAEGTYTGNEIIRKIRAVWRDPVHGPGLAILELEE